MHRDNLLSASSRSLLTLSRKLTKNRNLNPERLKKMVAKFSSDGGVHLTRTNPDHAIKITLENSSVDKFADILIKANPDLKCKSKKDLSCHTLGPFNRLGRILELPESGAKEITRDSTFRVEAGQHRLAAALQLPVADHEGFWPAFIYRRNFTDSELQTMRMNRDEITFKDTAEDVLFQLAPFFRLKHSATGLTGEQTAAMNTKRSQLAGKIKTSLNKDWANELEALIGSYPHIVTNWTQNQAAVLNGSIHNDVRRHDIAMHRDDTNYY